MKRYFLFLFAFIVVAACNKTTTLPSYVPPIAKNFSVATLNHTLDTVNVGDTIYLTATGIASDSSQYIIHVPYGEFNTRRCKYCL